MKPSDVSGCRTNRKKSARAVQKRDGRVRLLLILSSELEVLASLEDDLVRLRALGALELEHNLLGRLHLLVEHGLGLASITGLLAVIAALS